MPKKSEKCFTVPSGKVVCSGSKGAKKNYDDEKVKCSNRKGTWRKGTCKGNKPLKAPTPAVKKALDKERAKRQKKKPRSDTMAKKYKSQVGKYLFKPKTGGASKPASKPKPKSKPASKPKPKKPKSPPSRTSRTAPIPKIFKPNKWLKIEEDMFIKLTNGRKGIIVYKTDGRFKKYKGEMEQYKEKGKKAKESFNWQQKIKDGQFKGKYRQRSSEYIDNVSNPSPKELEFLKPIK